MEKEFVPYELALRMRNLGFNEPCFVWADIYTKENVYMYPTNENNMNQYDETVSIPLFQQAFRWFRDKYNIFPEIVTDCTTEPKFCYTYTRFFGNQNDLSSEEWGWENNIGQYSLLYRIYEEAELACLEKLIKIVEENEFNKQSD
jgi:hypothetical protein